MSGWRCLVIWASTGGSHFQPNCWSHDLDNLGIVDSPARCLRYLGNWHYRDDPRGIGHLGFGPPFGNSLVVEEERHCAVAQYRFRHRSEEELLDLRLAERTHHDESGA